MKVTGKIIYSVSFEYNMDEEMFKEPYCKDTGYANDWILDTSEADVGLSYDDMHNLKEAIKQKSPLKMLL